MAEALKSWYNVLKNWTGFRSAQKSGCPNALSNNCGRGCCTGWPKIFPLSSLDNIGKLPQAMGATPVYEASCVLLSPAPLPTPMLRSLTCNCVRGTGVLINTTSLLSLAKETRLPNRGDGVKTTQISLGCLMFAQHVSNVCLHFLLRPSQQTSTSPGPACLRTNSSACPLNVCFQSGTLFHGTSSASCNKSALNKTNRWFLPATASCLCTADWA